MRGRKSPPFPRAPGPPEVALVDREIKRKRERERVCVCVCRQLTEEEHPPAGPVKLERWQMLAWCAGLAFFGVFFAAPLREQTIVRERLKFPSGTATAQARGPRPCVRRVNTNMCRVVTLHRNGRVTGCVSRPCRVAVCVQQVCFVRGGRARSVVAFRGRWSGASPSQAACLSP